MTVTWLTSPGFQSSFFSPEDPDNMAQAMFEKNLLNIVGDYPTFHFDSENFSVDLALKIDSSPKVVQRLHDLEEGDLLVVNQGESTCVTLEVDGKPWGYPLRNHEFLTTEAIEITSFYDNICNAVREALGSNPSRVLIRPISDRELFISVEHDNFVAFQGIFEHYLEFNTSSKNFEIFKLVDEINKELRAS